MSESFFNQIKKLMSILSESITVDEKFKRLQTLLFDNDVEREFWKRIDDPAWIVTLNARRYFDNPPPVIQVDGGGEQYPPWPASRYLARMASLAPSEVATIFSKMETDNLSVIGDLLDAALTMPANIAKSLVPTICRVARNKTFWFHFDEASKLCVRLVEGGELDAAMKLTEALFTPKFEKDREEPSRGDAFWHKDGLKKVAPMLAKLKPLEFLPKLCDWLKASVEAKKDIKPNTGFDLSYIWRPAIEEHEQNHDYDFAGVMVGFVRGGFEEAIQNKSLSLDEALQIVERYPYLVFKRMRLHLIGEFANQNPDLARQEMLNRELFDDYEFKHEYAMLVGKRLDLLTPTERQGWFGWIDAGPDMSDYDKIFQERTGREVTEQDRQNRINYWKFEKLYWVRKHLKGQRKTFYEKMLTVHGEPDLADLNVRIGPTTTGVVSPMTVEDLQGMTFVQIVEKVSSWRSEKAQFMGPNIEGLASTFANYVATNPEAFSTEARVLIDKPAIFVHRFISQMDEAVKNNREIDLSAVLSLCQWVIGRPIDERTTPKQEDDMLVDENWQWTRDCVLHFIENICKAKHGDKPKYPLDTFCEILWKLIKPLCLGQIEFNIVRDISQDDPRVHDYLDLGINSSRGRAIETALEYARWVGNHIQVTVGKKEIIRDGFNAMPEFRELLEDQITPANRGIDIMSVIGARIGLIYWIDKNWLKENVEKIFPLTGIEQSPPVVEGWAAWNAFLVWVSPHIEFYRLFKSQFAYAVEQAAKVKLTKDTHQQPMYRLGEHLMLLYGRGQLGLDEDGGLLRNFLQKAHPYIRRHAIGFVGRSLDEEKEKIPDDVIDRFMKMYDTYWPDPGKKDAAENPDAWLFGVWFSSGKFPQQWSLDRLEEFVEVAPISEPYQEIVKKLSVIAHIDIVKSVRILDLMAHGDKEGWRISNWQDPAMKILKLALQTTGDARDKALGLIDYLGRRGYIEFGKLLSENFTPSE